ncbi:hypothetical protein RhiirA4_475909 [Rhizophagus irregularis]|uniref:Uncharacterized protein n=1 Tax=Rhizophagus irregularis TaxID=588596 RepID=A0A2I1HAX3_9GLOM|nr:hypothetical protein RhiirA4_475909 [Rhizophagus irregularis]
MPYYDHLRNAYLQLGWALKENQKFGRKGTDSRIPKEIVSLLQGFFLAGNANKSDCYSEQDMYDDRYSRQMKKEAAEKASENIGEGSESNKRMRM